MKTSIPFLNSIADPALYDMTKYKVQVDMAVFYAENYVYFRIYVNSYVSIIKKLSSMGTGQNKMETKGIAIVLLSVLINTITSEAAECFDK